MVPTADVYPASSCGSMLSAASLDGFSPASTSTAPRHRRRLAGPHTRFGKRRGDRFAISCRFAVLLQFAEVEPPSRSPSPSGCFHRQFWLIGSITREHRPDDSRILVGQRDRRDIGMPPLTRLAEPVASRILFAARATQSGTSAMDHQRAQMTPPRLLLPNSRAHPLLYRRFGTRPSHPANWRPFLKQVLSPTAAINAVAVIGPMPSILPRRWHGSLLRKIYRIQWQIGEEAGHRIATRPLSHDDISVVVDAVIPIALITLTRSMAH